MPNALKIPIVSDDFAGENHVDKVGVRRVSKYRILLLILFLLVLGSVVFSLVFNQKKQIVAEKKLPEPPSVASSEIKTARPKALPSADISKQPKTFSSGSTGGNIDLAYKGDKEYLALNRYERFSQSIKKPIKINKQNVRETVTAGDKPLALAGRGFDIKRFQPQTRTVGYVDFSHRLQRPFPKMEPLPEDQLDLRLTQAKSSKDLIFHPLRHALGVDNRQIINRGDERLDIKKPQVLADIPETKLLLMEGKKSFLILRRGGESLDLLSGNEKINRKKFNRW